MRKLFKKLANTIDPNSFSSQLRRKRFSLFLEIIKRLEEKHKRPLNILDVGGWLKFWEIMEFHKTQHKITVLNIEKVDSDSENIICVIGDARNMSQFSDLEFDVVFSNSVIEHLGTFENQIKMAEEIKRLSNNYFVQTPSFYFPLEPHFLFPFFHWLPKKIKVWLLTKFSLGWFEQTKDLNEAEKIIDEIRLLKFSEMKKLFPNARIYRERFMGITKSYIAIKT